MTKTHYSIKNDVCMQPWGHLDDNDSSSVSENDIKEVKNDE